MAAAQAGGEGGEPVRPGWTGGSGAPRAAEVAGSGTVHVEKVMGTIVTLDVRDALPARQLQAAVADAVEVLHRVDEQFSTYRPDSHVSRLRDGRLTEAQLPTDLVTVAARCALARDRSSGWFDPWSMPGGFDPTGLVKGWAAQQALLALKRAGARHAMVNAGGDIALAGNASGTDDGLGWRVGVQHPTRPGALLTTLLARDTGIATSGGYERGSLAVDPRTGGPVTRLASATVLASDLALADAYATAACAHGPDALGWLTAAGVEALLVTIGGDLLRTTGWADDPLFSGSSVG